MAVAASSELNLEPSLEEARALAAQGNVVPVRARFVDDCETPVSAFLKLRAGEAPGAPCFLLESAEQGQVGRYSFVGIRPRSVLRWSDGRLGEDGGGAATRPTPTRRSPSASAATGRRRSRACRRSPAAPSASSATTWSAPSSRWREPNPDPLGLPDMALMITDVLLVFDHLKHELTILSCAFVEDGGGGRRRLRARRGDDRRRPRAPARRRPRSPSGPTVGEPPTFTSNMEREEFEAAVERIVEYVHAGDAFQVVPSQRFSAPAPVEAFSVYRGLRAVNPSPYMYFLEFGDFQIAGASPEPLVKVTGDRVETRPIAGTYPRGSDEDEDRRLAERLVNDPKERAEHVMLVDLGRNDLGRVCEYGTVSVDELMVVETYSHVLHIVSQVSGTLREGVGAMDVLRSALPAGTLSGAPKVRAMQIIDELEPVKRCSYGGAIGYLSWNGDLDTAIHIRTVVVKDGADPRPGRRRHRRRRQARLRVQRVGQQGEGGLPRRRARLRAAGLGLAMKVLVIDNYDSFAYNLVQYLGELGAEVEVVRNDKAEVGELLERGAERLVVSPGPCTPAEAGISVEASAPSPRRARRCSASASGTSRWSRPSAAASSSASRSTARTPRSSTTAARSSPGSRARWSPAATTRWSPTPTRCPTSSRSAPASATWSWAPATASCPPRGSSSTPSRC